MNNLSSISPNVTSLGPAQFLLTSLLTTLIASYNNIYPNYPPDRSDEIFDSDDEFDFIVVGAGSAGAAVANRLSEIPSCKVLLIEAGADPPIESDIPMLWASLMNSRYDWNYKVEPSSESCRSMIGNRCVWPKGKMLGGSSSMNGMLYVRGNHKDYDRWAELGNTGWDYKSVLKYFKKLEKVEVSGGSNAEIHGYNGYVSVQRFPHATLRNLPIAREMVKKAAEELGLPYVDDLNSNTRPGVTYSWGTVKNGERANTAKAYLVPIRDRPNLFVMKQTKVTELILKDGKTIGVQVEKRDRKHPYKSIRCRKEVILSAGAIESPKILLLSGIGPADYLNSIPIRVVKDLKVGYNLQDHIMFVGIMAKLNLPAGDDFQSTDEFYNYLTKRTEFGSSAVDWIVFIDTLNAKSEDYPDVQYFNLPSPTRTALLTTFFGTLNLKPEIVEQVAALNKDHYIINIISKLLRPKSRGRLKLNTPTHKDPIIESGYLTHRDDVETLIRSVKFAKKMIETRAFANATVWMPEIRECAQHKAYSDPYYECYVRNLIATVYHAAGTCKMGPQDDPDAVVDARLRVYGIEGLRVADASIIPEIISGNTNVPTIMIGEKAADMIKEDWSLLSDQFQTEL